MSIYSLTSFALLFVGSQLVLCSHDEPGALWIPSPHYNTGRAGRALRYIIIHGTAGGSSAKNIGMWYQRKWVRASSHYVVDQKGIVVQCVREGDTAWATGRIEPGADKWWTSDPNRMAISIEHVKSSTDNSNHLTDAQKTASFRLIQNIIARNPGITPTWADSNGGITGHFSIAPQSRAKCPGPFPWSELFAEIDGAEPPCIGTVTATIGLRVRHHPTSASRVVAILNFGQTFTFSERVEGDNVHGHTGWLRTPQGYMSAHYISLRDPKPTWCHK